MGLFDIFRGIADVFGAIVFSLLADHTERRENRQWRKNWRRNMGITCFEMLLACIVDIGIIATKAWMTAVFLFTYPLNHPQCSFIPFPSQFILVAATPLTCPDLLPPTTPLRPYLLSPSLPLIHS